jgi:hypothetical protein
MTKFIILGRDNSTTSGWSEDSVTGGADRILFDTEEEALESVNFLAHEFGNDESDYQIVTIEE